MVSDATFEAVFSTRLGSYSEILFNSLFLATYWYASVLHASYHETRYTHTEVKPLCLSFFLFPHEIPCHIVLWGA